MKIAQKQRGLTFLHPVTVRFLPAAEFEKTVTTDDKDLDKDDRKEHRAVLPADAGLWSDQGRRRPLRGLQRRHRRGDARDYSFADQRITVRGSKVTPAIRSTLVHELTHVLQDQHFKVGDRLQKLRKEADKGASTSESSVLDAIVEGDAERVETLYRASLTPKQRTALDTGRQSESGDATERLKRVPKVVISMITSPYTLGEALVQTVAVDDGNSGVDKLYRDSLEHETSLLDPFEVLAGDTDAKKVGLPKLDDGDKKFDSGEFGVLTWYFMLAERLPLLDALVAADGWGGDAYVAYDHDGKTCARVDYTGDSDADTTRMLSALQRWVAAAPGSPAKVSRDGDVVQFESCDPGKTAGGGKDASEDALNLAATRTYLGIGLLQAGAPEKRARCLAGELAREYPVAKLQDREFAATPAVKTRVQQLAARCA